MSRVIKGIVWDNNPIVITAPTFSNVKSGSSKGLVGKSSLDDDNVVERMSDDAYTSLMKNILDREKQAEKVLRDAQIKCEILKAEALQEARLLGQRDAEAYMAEARKTAKIETDGLRKATYEIAYQEGIEKGREDGKSQLFEEQTSIINSANEKAQRIVANAELEAKKIIYEGENLIADMVIEVATKVLIKHTIDVPSAILPLVREAIIKVKDQPKVTVRVCPSAYESVLTARVELQSLLEGNVTLDVEADEALEPGDCLVESPNGTVDARLSVQLEQIRQAISKMKNDL